MHRLWTLILTGTAIALVAAPALARAASAPPWSILPEPVIARPDDAGSVRVATGDAVALCSSATPQDRRIVTHFVRIVEKTRGIHLHLLTPGHCSGARIAFKLDRHLNAGSMAGYRIDIKDGQIRALAANARGMFYAADTVWDLLTPNSLQGAVEVRDGYIEDYPRFAWRGFMLDSSRHFQTVRQIEHFIDWMSLLKMNVFHWHLTDDQGWRLEIPKYPELTKIGSCRSPIGYDVVLTRSRYTDYCGHYSTKDVAEIVRYAAHRFVTVVPQIELPGHSQAAIASYPGLGTTGRRPDVASSTGISSWILAPSPYTMTFMQNVMEEVLRLFPSTYIHIGGDEAVKDQWEASATVQARAKELGLKNMNELQGWMAQQVGDYAVSRGRRVVAETEVLRTPTMFPLSFVVMPWRGLSTDVVAAANNGRDVVESLTPRWYMDFVQSRARNEPPGQASAVASLEGFYNFNPMRKGLTKKGASHILGVEAKLWTEFMYTFAEDQHAAFPRMAAMAEVAWSPEARRNWDSFLRRMPAQLSRDKEIGIRYADSAWQPRFAFRKTGRGTEVSLSDQVHRGEIRYTVNGAMPSTGSALYSEPIFVPDNRPVTLRAATFATDGFELGGPRTQPVDSRTALTKYSEGLSACSAHPNYLQLPSEAGRPGDARAYLVDVRDMCWLWPDAPTSGVDGISINIARLTWTFMGPEIRKTVVVRPSETKYGELDVRLGSCDGTLLARIPFGRTSSVTKPVTLSASFERVSGDQSLCVYATGSPLKALWAVNSIELHARTGGVSPGQSP